MTKKNIAVFDFDGTITSKDSLIAFIKFSKGKASLAFGFLLFFPLLIAVKLKIYPNWKVKEKVFSYFYKGISIEQFNYWGKEFSQLIQGFTRPKAQEAILSHLSSHHKVMLISASIENWVLPWAKEMGIETVLATQIEVDKDQKITGKFLSKNCYGIEKVNRLLEIISDRDAYWIIAYGDSTGDKDLIAFADEGYYNKFV